MNGRVSVRPSVRLYRRLTCAARYRPTDAGAQAAAAGNVLLRAEVRGSTVLFSLLTVFLSSTSIGDSVAEWLACWTQAQYGLGSNRSRDAGG